MNGQPLIFEPGWRELYIQGWKFTWNCVPPASHRLQAWHYQHPAEKIEATGSYESVLETVWDAIHRCRVCHFRGSTPLPDRVCSRCARISKQILTENARMGHA